jgi:hypothetical protein
MNTNASRKLLVGLLCASVLGAVHEVYGQATAAFRATSFGRVNLPTTRCTNTWRHVGGINDYSGTSADAVISKTTGSAVVFAGGTQTAPGVGGLHVVAISENRDVAGFMWPFRYSPPSAAVAEYSASTPAYSVKLLPDPPMVNGLAAPTPDVVDGYDDFQESIAVAINNRRVLVGETTLTYDPPYPGDECFWTFPARWTAQPDGSYVATRLRTAMFPPGYPVFPPGVHTELFPMPGAAYDINDAGTIVGEQNGSAVIFRDGADPYVLRDPFGRSPNKLTAAFGVSSDGRITGIGDFRINDDPPIVQQRGFIWTSSRLGVSVVRTRVPAGSNSSVARKVNRLGLAVGTFYFGPTLAHAALWNSDGQLARLSLNFNKVALLYDMGPNYVDVVLEEAIDINDHNEMLVVGFSRDKDGNEVRRAFLLTPTGYPIRFDDASITN